MPRVARFDQLKNSIGNVTCHVYCKLKRLFLFVCILLLSNCATDYELMPKYEEYKDQIETIALFQMHLRLDVKMQRIFRNAFSGYFFSFLKVIPMKRPIEFIQMDKSLEYLYANNNIFSNSKKVDAVIICNLTHYNEVSPDVALAQKIGTGIATRLLTGGMFGASTSEKNELQMQITLYNAATKDKLWVYDVDFSERYLNDPRREFTKRVIEKFIKYFPYSKNFEED